MKMLSKIKRGNGKSKAVRNANGTAQPKQFQSTARVDKLFRFKSGSATTVNLSVTDLGDLFCVAATTTSAYQLGAAVKVKHIEIWGPPSSSLDPVTVSVEWLGTTAGTFGNSLLVSDTSVGATRVAHIKSRPPVGSQVAQWQPSASTATICQLTFPVNAIIDLRYSVMLRGDNGGSPVAVTAAVAGATVGQLYCRALTSTSSTTLVPLSFNTI